MKPKLTRFADLPKPEFRRFQQKVVDMLSYFDAFCRKNGLRYFLTNGTCLGAVRHKGFIPWDDDMDIALPREDYEQLFRLWNNHGNRYQLIRPGKNVLTGVHIAQLRDSQTTCIYDYAMDYDICHGIKIDVETIDGCPDGRIARWSQSFFCKVYGLMAAQRVPHHASKPMKMLAKILLLLIPCKNVRYWLFSRAERQVRKYATSAGKCLRFNYGLVLDKSIFSEAVEAEFEGGFYPIAKEFDLYLRIVYGDYMALPPPEKRFPETEVVLLDLDQSYLKYKGAAYCLEK